MTFNRYCFGVVPAIFLKELLKWLGEEKARYSEISTIDLSVVSIKCFAVAITTQSDGSKAHCIAELIKKGYDSKNVVMCGDAEGDLKAAESNGTAFYPIMVNNEVISWKQLPAFLQKFINGGAADDIARLRSAFYKNLNAKEG